MTFPGGEGTDMDDTNTDDGADGDGMDDNGTQSDDATDVEDLPELANPLPELIKADDREAFANAYDIDYRDGAVKVRISLAEGAERPDDHLEEVTDHYGDTVMAWVKIDSLVALAREDAVVLVSPAREPKTETV